MVEQHSSSLIQRFFDDDGGGYSGYPSRLSSQTTEKSPRSFASAIKTIKPIAGSIIEEFRDLPEVPDEVSVEFGIKMSATSGLVITSSESVSNFRITLKWKTSK